MLIFKTSPITLGLMDPVEMVGVRTQPVPLLLSLEAMMDASKHLLERDIVFLDTKSKGRPARWMKSMCMHA